MKKMMFFAAAFTMVATLMAAPAQFPYQAVLKNANGTAMTGTKVVEFRLYGSADATKAVWGHAYSVQLDANGLFNMEVSDSKGTVLDSLTTPLDDVIVAQQDLWIGLKVQGTAGEIKPRQHLLPVPYAAVASNVYNAPGNFEVKGKLQAKNAVVTGDLTAKSVTVNGTATAGTVNTTGNATISGNLTVSGTISGFGIAPVGTIIMWSGAPNTIPPGWSICNGEKINGVQTPDLTNRFIVGAGSSYAVGATGGEATHVLTAAEMPSHNHAYRFSGADTSGSYKKDNFFYNQHGKYGDLGNTKYTEYTGGNQPHENRPPYYALYFIMRTN